MENTESITQRAFAILFGEEREDMHEEERMGEFGSMARQIAGEIAERRGDGGGIRATDIPDIIEQAFGSEVNCYPGIPSGCHSKLVLVSLESKRYKQGRGHLNFSQALQYLVRHMQGSCPGITRSAVLILDTWNPNEIDFWLPNIQQIQRSAYIEFYMLSGNGCRRVSP